MRSVIVLLLFLLMKAAPVSSQEAERCFQEGIAKNFDLAIYYCTQVIESGGLSEKKLAIAYNNRGIGYDEKRDYNRAIQDFSQAIRLDPSYAIAYNNRGNAYRDKQDYDSAIRDYSQAIRLDPSYVIAFNNRGNAYRYKQDFDSAIRDYSQAIRLNPKYAIAYNNRGYAYFEKKDYDRAIQDFSQAIRLDPKYAIAYSNRGNAYLSKNDYSRAIEDYRQTLQLDPKNAGAYANRAHARFFQGEFATAVPDFTRAAELQSSYPYYAIWLYLAEARAGRNARPGLTERAERLDLSKWPGPVIEFLLERKLQESLLRAAEDPDPKKRNEQVCEANFFAAQVRLIRGANDDALPLLRAAQRYCPPHFVEFMAAQAELMKLGY
jgi:lipoprotein NlpI